MFKIQMFYSNEMNKIRLNAYKRQYVIVAHTQKNLGTGIRNVHCELHHIASPVHLNQIKCMTEYTNKTLC